MMRQMVALEGDSMTTASKRKDNSRTNYEDPRETVVDTYHRVQRSLQEAGNTSHGPDKVPSSKPGEVGTESIQ